MTPVQALQKALAGEHAAVNLYGLLGAQASKSRQPVLFKRLEQAYEAHRASRARLTELGAAKGADPVAAGTDYAAPGPTSNATEIEAVARTIEKRLTRTYAELVANTAKDDRRWAIAALDASALREVALGVAPATFPGLN